MLSPWPVPRPGKDPLHRPPHWLELVNAQLNAAELDALRLASRRGRPYGDSGWVEQIAERYDLSATLRNPGRPRKDPE